MNYLFSSTLFLADSTPILVGSIIGVVVALVAIIGALTTLIVGVITAVCTMVAQTNVAKYAAVDKQAVEASTPDASDFDGLNMAGGESIKSWIPLAAIGVGLLFLLKS